MWGLLQSELFQREEEKNKTNGRSLAMTVHFCFTRVYCVNANDETMVEKTADSAFISNAGGGVGELPGLVECRVKPRLMQFVPLRVEYATQLNMLPAPAFEPLSLTKFIPLMVTCWDWNEPGVYPCVNGLEQVVALVATFTSKYFSTRFVPGVKGNVICAPVFVWLLICPWLG